MTHPTIQKAIDIVSSKLNESRIVVLPLADGQVRLVTVSIHPIARDIEVSHFPLAPAMARKIAGLLLAAASVAEGHGTPADIAALEPEQS